MASTQLKRITIGSWVRLSDGKPGRVRMRSISKRQLHSRGEVKKLPDRVTLWVETTDGNLIHIDREADERMEVIDDDQATEPSQNTDHATPV